METVPSVFTLLFNTIYLSNSTQIVVEPFSGKHDMSLFLVLDFVKKTFKITIHVNIRRIFLAGHFFVNAKQKIHT